MNSPSALTLAKLRADPGELTRIICDIESVSGQEKELADEIEAVLRQLPLNVTRHANTVVARTEFGAAERVILAGHIDTVPLAAKPNLPTWVVSDPHGELLYGRGTCDMKGGVAVQLALAAGLTTSSRDITYIFYEGEEVAADKNGLLLLQRQEPTLLAGDFAILLEPTRGQIEGGCNGTLRAEIKTTGVAAHSARAWMGRNAIHEAGPVLDLLRAYTPQTRQVDGLAYREGLNAVGITGGIAGNVIPDVCVVTVNFRFAPDRSLAQAEAHLRQVFAGYEVRITDQGSAARPGLDQPLAQEFVAALGVEVHPKYGWTDVARFGELGIPAVNYGPGDPLTAHADHEHVRVQEIRDCVAALSHWLSSPASVIS